MNTHKKLIALLFTLTFIAAIYAKQPQVYIWPRNSEINLPTAIEKFMFLEIPACNKGERLELKINMPDGLTVKNFPRAFSSMVLPHKNRCIYPQRFSAEKNVYTLIFPEAPEKDESHKFLCMTVSVNTTPGKHQMTVDGYINGKKSFSKMFRLKIHAPLSAKQPAKMTVGVYDYAGLEEEYIPILMNMLKQAGVNAVYHMHGEKKGKKSTADFAEKYGMRNALVFFTYDVVNFYKYRKLPLNVTKNDLGSINALLDKPEALKIMVREFFNAAFNKKNYSCVVYDAENGPFSKLGGDRSPYCIEQFRKAAGIPATEEITAHTIATKHRTAFVKYQCGLTARFAKLVRDVLDDHFPDFRYEVYSGYEVDNGPNKNITRERYAVDWKTLADTGFDYATAGYFGSTSLIRNTAEAVSGKAMFIPAEMYIDGFKCKEHFSRTPDAWSVRLLNSILNSDRQGIMFWYANVLDGNALIAIDRISNLLCKTEDFFLNGELDNNAVIVKPVAMKNNCYVLKQGGSICIFLLNPGKEPKNCRVVLKDFKTTNYTG